MEQSQGINQGESKAQQRHRQENTTESSANREGIVTDKKLEGPNRPAE